LVKATGKGAFNKLLGDVTIELVQLKNSKQENMKIVLGGVVFYTSALMF
jgi:hypothetical protein